MAYKNVEDLVIENARIIFRNFTGREAKYNDPGVRNFCVIIEDAGVAQNLADDGWNVRILPPRGEDEEGKHYIQVAVGFERFPPRIFMVTQKRKTLLNEGNVESLDYAEIINVDLTIRARVWDDNGRRRVKAYLKEMYATIEEDRFADKYSHLDNPDEDESFC